MATKPDAPPPTDRSAGWRLPVLIALALVLGFVIFGLYFLVYRTRHYPLPVGFDAPWYIWRADFVAARGIGPVGTAVRPGHAVLAAILGALTGRSQLELQVVLPLVLVPVLALAAGALFVSAFGGGRWGWIVAAGVTGGFLGATRLVGENVANLLFLALVAGALCGLARRLDGGPGFVVAVALLVAAGLAHWIFLGVFALVLGLTAALAIPESRRQRQAGVSLWRTESGVVVGVAGAVGAIMALTIAVFLRAPLQTVEIRENPRRFVPKLRTDFGRLWLPLAAPLAAAGGWALERARRPPRGRFGLRLLLAWTLVTVFGIVYGAATKNVPPHRFLALWVGLPGVILIAGAITRAAEWLRARGSGALAAAVAAVGVTAVAVPGAVAWFGHGPGVWMSPLALREAETAAAYVGGLPPGTPVVFEISAQGRAGILSAALKERTIRVALPPDRQPDAHFFVGTPADLLARRRTPAGAPTLRATQDYWDDVRAVLPRDPPVLIVRALGSKEFVDATGGFGATEIAPGVALLRGPSPAQPLVLPPPPTAVPPVRAALAWGLVLMLALGVAGAGWAVALLGRDSPREVLVGVAPSMGAGALILIGVVAAKLGIRLGGAGGVVTFAAVAVAGAALAFLRGRSTS